MSQLVVTEKRDELIDRLVAKYDSPHTRKAYARSLRQFLLYWDGGELNAASVRRYIDGLAKRGLGSSVVYQHIAALHLLVDWAVLTGHVTQLAALELKQVKGKKQRGIKAGHWLTKQEAQSVLRSPNLKTMKGLRDRAILAIFLGCGLRRSELASLRVEHVQQREGRWVLLDIVGKGNKSRTVPVPAWAKVALDEWTNATKITKGFLFRSLNRGGRITGEQMTTTALYHLVMTYANVSPHDLRRTHAKLSLAGGAELTQIQLCLGHSSIATTERYLNAELDLTDAPGDKLGLRL